MAGESYVVAATMYARLVNRTVVNKIAHVDMDGFYYYYYYIKMQRVTRH